ncbi:Outer envelope protein 39, chloroplastic [Orobanche minor]
MRWEPRKAFMLAMVRCILLVSDGPLCFNRDAGGGSPLSLVIGSLCIKHPNLFGKSEKLHFLWDKGLCDSNISITYRKSRPERQSQHAFIIQHSMSPEVGIHGVPVDNFSRSESGGVNLSRVSIGVDLIEPSSSNWSSKTNVKFEHVRPFNDDGCSISGDIHGFPVTCSGGYHDSMVVVKQESRYAEANDRGFTRFSLQIEQGIPILSKWLIFNRFKFVASKGIKLGPAFLLTSLTGGSIVGDMAPYQAFSIGGPGSVRGYGEGAIGSGTSCVVASSELTLPLNPMLEGVVFLDGGSDLTSGRCEILLLGMANQEAGSVLDTGFGLNLMRDTFKSTLLSMPFNREPSISSSAIFRDQRRLVPVKAHCSEDSHIEYMTRKQCSGIPVLDCLRIFLINSTGFRSKFRQRSTTQLYLFKL